MTTARSARYALPGGTLTVVAEDRDGTWVVVTSGYDADVVARSGRTDVEATDALPGVDEAVEAYLVGDSGALDAVAVDQPGGEFYQAAWRAMREIPPGQTWTYAELAAKVGRPAAVRAAGSACARNQVAPFVPCHRVLRSDGTLGGYAYGLPVKRALLAHERGAVEEQPALL